jgi:hypothetical protein
LSFFVQLRYQNDSLLSEQARINFKQGFPGGLIHIHSYNSQSILVEGVVFLDPLHPQFEQNCHHFLVLSQTPVIGFVPCQMNTMYLGMSVCSCADITLVVQIQGQSDVCIAFSLDFLGISRG